MARKVGGSGRLRFALVLLGFVAIASGVVLRRTAGIRAARELQAMETRRSSLVAERSRLESEIRVASSRARLQPIAESRLRMRVPTEDQVVYLTRGAKGSDDKP
jgi:cell division protein FtsL